MCWMTILTLTLFPAAGAYAVDDIPSWILGPSQPFTADELEAYNAMVASEATVSSDPDYATTQSPEIEALARALLYDRNLIYAYVRDRIDYQPYYGSLKGATLTYLDGCGNDFDQAS